jgi:hypothetical protein
MKKLHHIRKSLKELEIMSDPSSKKEQKVLQILKQMNKELEQLQEESQEDKALALKHKVISFKDIQNHPNMSLSPSDYMGRPSIFLIESTAGVSYNVKIHPANNYGDNDPIEPWIVGFHREGYGMDRPPLTSYYVSTILNRNPDYGLWLHGADDTSQISWEVMEQVKEWMREELMSKYNYEANIDAEK